MLPGERELEKQRKTFQVILSCALALVVLIPAALALVSRGEVLVRDSAGRFYRTRLLVGAGDYALCLKGPRLHGSRQEALRDTDGRDLSMLSLKRTELLEVVSGEVPKEEPRSPAGFSYAGTYRVNAAGHAGLLYLREHEGKPAGTVRFPKWGKGASEPLYGVDVKGRNISFTRSVSTEREMVRVGAQHKFVQRYFGKFSEDGRTVRGHFLRSGTRYSWEGVKVK
jgi:hypothetical protein